MSENILIGIVTKDRYDCLDALLYSLRFNNYPTVIIDVSEHLELSHTEDYNRFYNTPLNRRAVVYNKNMIMRLFLNSGHDYLFIIEDDVKILDNDVFQYYVEASVKHNIHHMNFCGYPLPDRIRYDYNDDIQISENLMGVFSFYTKECIQNVGLMNERLCHNCWEHIEHTARINKYYKYNPEFYHFPDISNSWEYLRLQKTAPAIVKDEQYDRWMEEGKRIMVQSLGWQCMPIVSIKKLTIG
jgi:hypothetical protein